MNRRTDHEDLFSDALADAAPAGFRDALLDQTLGHARRRRRWRQVRRGTAVLAVLGVVAVLVSRERQLPRPPSVPTMASYELVRTQPLHAGSVVTTSPLPSNWIAAAQPGVAIVLTTSGNHAVREINDEQLLALAPQPAVLVRMGLGSAELIFPGSPDLNGTP